MIASWMLYALLVSVLTAAGAGLLEGALRMRGAPVRFVWLGALLATVGLVALAPLRMAPAARPAAPGITVLSYPAATAEVRAAGLAERALAAVRSGLARPLREAAALGTGPAGRALAAAWALLSAGLLLVVAGTALRARRARRGWPRAEIAGHGVRVSPGTGPAALGILRPEVVVPAWLLDATDEEQRLVVLHEREHVRARDPLVLTAGCVAAALLPWSPAAWWMLLRLRAAVELDCDGRVLRGGVARRAYGSLLIDMAGRGPGLSLGTPAFAGAPSTLEQRLRAMSTRLPRFARLRATLLGVLGLALLAGACDTPLPTAAELERMDVATLEARTLELRPAQDRGNVTYFVDGKQMTADEAHALVGDRIVRMEVTRGATAAESVVRIDTKQGGVADGEHPRVHTMQGAGGDAAGERLRRAATAATLEVQADTPIAGRVRIRTAGAGTTGEHPLLVIDGVISDQSALQALAPEGIERIEVIKGATAAAQYPNDPRAANGVIRIITKKAADH
jgi:beta-lactamase regulating signal transducer with metallopeptidase domain